MSHRTPRTSQPARGRTVTLSCTVFQTRSHLQISSPLLRQIYLPPSPCAPGTPPATGLVAIFHAFTTSICAPISEFGRSESTLTRAAQGSSISRATGFVSRKVRLSKGIAPHAVSYDELIDDEAHPLTAQQTNLENLWFTFVPQPTSWPNLTPDAAILSDSAAVGCGRNEFYAQRLVLVTRRFRTKTP
ncbi:MAG: hypothetical protein Q9177_002988 [Variospora cf. flavescens]